MEDVPEHLRPAYEELLARQREQAVSKDMRANARVLKDQVKVSAPQHGHSTACPRHR